MADNLERNVYSNNSRRNFLKLIGTGAISIGLAGGIALPAEAMSIRDSLSVKNVRREKRSKTDYIILHTTEAGNTSSRNMVKKYGLANYLIETDGSIDRVIDREKIAIHAGRSMWDGNVNLNNSSIGIEVVGYHNKPITPAQVDSLGELLEELQRIYKISDKNVLPHSMVAYGTPNRWHPYNHRGRKRCGMLFADKNLRKSLGLEDSFDYDIDVSAGRLRVADNLLENVLYGKATLEEIKKASVLEDTITNGITAWTIARNQYDAPTTIYEFPNGNKISGDEIRDWGTIPRGTKVRLNVGETSSDDMEYFHKLVGSDTAWKVAGKEFDAPTTIYFLPRGIIRTGRELGRYDLDHLPRDTEILIGYVYGGKVTKTRSAYNITGTKWNDPSTFYRLPDKRIVSGDDLDSLVIPQGTTVFFRR